MLCPGTDTKRFYYLIIGHYYNDIIITLIRNLHFSSTYIHQTFLFYIYILKVLPIMFFTFIIIYHLCNTLFLTIFFFFWLLDFF